MLQAGLDSTSKAYLNACVNPAVTIPYQTIPETSFGSNEVLDEACTVDRGYIVLEYFRKYCSSSTSMYMKTFGIKYVRKCAVALVRMRLTKFSTVGHGCLRGSCRNIIPV